MKIMGEGKRRSGRESLDGARGNPGARGSLAPPVYPCDAWIRGGKRRDGQGAGAQWEITLCAQEKRVRGGGPDGELCSALPTTLVCLGLSRIYWACTPPEVKHRYK